MFDYIVHSAPTIPITGYDSALDVINGVQYFSDPTQGAWRLVSGGNLGAVVLEPTADQTITGDYALNLVGILTVDSPSQGGGTIELKGRVDNTTYAFSELRYSVINEAAPIPEQVYISFGAETNYSDGGVISNSDFYVYDNTQDQFILQCYGGANPYVFIEHGYLRIKTAHTVASAVTTGNTGTIYWDANYIYVCVAPNTWKRTALTTW
jgi:hypothetical protein